MVRQVAVVQINIDLNAIEAKALQLADKKCRDVAIRIQREARRMVQEGPKTGRIYMKGKKSNIPHQASAPGEAPATDTGNLVRGINFVHIGVAHWRIISSAEYANIEFGRARVRPRPYMRPSAKKIAEQTGAKYSG